ncbi:MAG: AraC family transcriptional regulator [Eubacteriales bacterium]|nr:AraC family transcriptional regulator [Eubacteriales bacterium]
MQFFVDAVSFQAEKECPQLVYVSKLEGRSNLPPRRLHSHRDLAEIVLILDKPGICQIGNQIYPVQKGDLLVYNPGVLHDEAYSGQQLPLLCCGIRGIHQKDLEFNHLLPENARPVIAVGDNFSRLQRLMQMIFDESQSGSQYSSQICQELFRALWYALIEQIDAACGDNGKSMGQHERLSDRVKEFLDSHLAESYSLKELADEFGVSVSYLSHSFKRATGHSVMQYMTQRRIGEAQTLLVTTTRPIKQIAQLVGYMDLSYFTRVFSHNVGMSPRKYRKVYEGKAQI